MPDTDKSSSLEMPVAIPEALSGVAELYTEALRVLEEMYEAQLSGNMTLSLEKSKWQEIVGGLVQGEAWLLDDGAKGTYRVGVQELTKGIYDLYPLCARDGRDELELVLGKVFAPAGQEETSYAGVAGVANWSYGPMIAEYDKHARGLAEELLKSCGYKVFTLPKSFPEVRCLDVFLLSGALNLTHKPISVFYSGGSKENVSSLSHMTVFINLYAARWKAITERLASKYITGAGALESLTGDEAARLLLLWLRGHDIGHFVGADRLSKSMSEQDRDYMILHELKSDMIALYNLKRLAGVIFPEENLKTVYLAAVAEMLRYIRRGGCVQHPDTGSAYLAYRHMSDMGAIRPEPWEGKFLVDVERFGQVVEEFTVSLVKLFAEGNSTQARGFVNSWGWLGVEEDDGLPRGCPDELRRMIADDSIPHYLDYDFKQIISCA